MDLQRRAAGVGENVPHPLALEGLDEDVGALARLVRSKSGNKGLLFSCFFLLMLLLGGQFGYLRSCGGWGS